MTLACFGGLRIDLGSGYTLSVTDAMLLVFYDLCVELEDITLCFLLRFLVFSINFGALFQLLLLLCGLLQKNYVDIRALRLCLPISLY